jgi:beta-lactamase superfamily II metal-dependent hydrolase
MKHHIPSLLVLLTACQVHGVPVQDTGSPSDTSDTATFITCYTDADADGWGDAPISTEDDTCPEGTVPTQGDCNDESAAVYPSAEEICDGFDNDCDADIDEEGASGAQTWYTDADADGYGSMVPGESSQSCTQPAGMAPEANDCNDDDPAIHPGATEICSNGIDEDCSSAADDDCPVVCGDDYVTPGVEECDGAEDDACPSLCSPFCTCPSLTPGDMEVHFINVDYGAAALVISPDGFTILVDAGSVDTSSMVLDYLDATGIPKLDYVLATHMHDDHEGGMADVLEARPEVLASFDNGSACASTACEDFIDAAGERRISLGEGDFDYLGPSVRAQIVHAGGFSSTENANSLVLRIDFDTFSMLVGGDCEGTICEPDLLDQDPVTVYGANHHGEDDASSTAFIAVITPEVSVISNNSTSDSLTVRHRLQDAGSEVYHTAENGDVIVTSDGTTWDVSITGT